jgi:acyl-CoA thioester hydrolase
MSWAHTHAERVRFGDPDAMKHLNNRSPAHFDEDVAIRVRPAEIGTKSLKLEFEMAVGERVIAEGHGYDYEKGQTVPLPDALKERLR